MDYEIRETPSEKVKKMYWEYLSLGLNDKVEFRKLIEDCGNPRSFMEDFSEGNLETIATLDDSD